MCAWMYAWGQAASMHGQVETCVFMVGLEVASLSHPSLLFTSLRQILQHLLQNLQAWEETAGPPDGLCRSNLAARIEALLD